MRGYFEVGIFHGKHGVNLGTLWRSAYQLGAAGIFTIGARYRPQASDTVKAPRHVPLREFLTFEDFNAHRPFDAPLIAVEMGGTPLRQFNHPERAIYLLGAEDHGLPASVLARCQSVVSLEAVGHPSFNVAVAGSLVLYDRVFGRGVGRGRALSEVA
jgi:tRNA G18 (ribose-2'-O)-methylase SpoU